MSNEVNISEVAFATADLGVEWTINHWGIQPQKARFFTVVPDPRIPFDGGTILIEPSGPYNIEITRVWSTVWVSDNGAITYQWNTVVTNVGSWTSAFHLLMAETDN